MTQQAAFSTKLPADLLRALDDVCVRLGLRKTFVVEQALRDKIEDLLDTRDLEEARKSASSFVSLAALEKRLRPGKKR